MLNYSNRFTYTLCCQTYNSSSIMEQHRLYKLEFPAIAAHKRMATKNSPRAHQIRAVVTHDGHHANHLHPVQLVVANDVVVQLVRGHVQTGNHYRSCAIPRKKKRNTRLN